ncbi:hypothetical protein NEF87_000283 [Candidatus Lokiarchaeum ossiferum]|uniref:Plant-type L-asparaginase n=1 Tax=Candidatus Lokiarchaeum ossiferum TaxID=2951803 RepID=A0ABY6HL10_9ARCH|nr:hypothetical protein NEF87_000283 [Candidatus Lokiarchaeum sp. B-35]
MQYGVIVHGGAGDFPNVLIKDHHNGVSIASQIAYQILEKGGSAIDAVEQAIISLENDPTFDAGKGSFYNKYGEIEMDAIIATDSYQVGSVCSIKNVQNPIQVARLVMDKTKNIMLVGKGAELFAREQKIPFYPSKMLQGSKELELIYGKEKMNKFLQKNQRLGTVGCVCLDKAGHYAIGLSTGGSFMKMKGRVGDTPLWGSGGYVEPIGGAAATGMGEDLIRILITRQALDYLRNGLSAQEAATRVIKDLKDKTNSSGRIILISNASFGYAFNTKKMSIAYRDDTMKEVHVTFN